MSDHSQCHGHFRQLHSLTFSWSFFLSVQLTHILEFLTFTFFHLGHVTSFTLTSFLSPISAKWSKRRNPIPTLSLASDTTGSLGSIYIRCCCNLRASMSIHSSSRTISIAFQRWDAPCTGCRGAGRLLLRLAEAPFRLFPILITWLDNNHWRSVLIVLLLCVFLVGPSTG